MTDHPKEYLPITNGELQGLEAAGLDETGDSFASTESRIKFVKGICKKVRSRPHPAPAEKQWTEEEVMHEISEAFDRGYEVGERLDVAEAAKAAREQVLDKIHDMCECVPSKDNDRDFDKGFHQAMTLVRGWCKSLRAQQEHPK